MQYNILLHPEANKDYIEAYLWYEEQQEDLGERFLAEVRQVFTLITNHPETFSSKSKKRQYREASLDKFPFCIVYKIYKEKGIIFVSAIHHFKKHPSKKYRK